MPRRIYDFGVPDRFVAGTVGLPGNRTFFLQARKGSALVSVVIEKVQVQVLAERLALLVAEIARRGVQVPEALAPSDDDTAPLGEPLVEGIPGRDHDAGLGSRARAGRHRGTRPGRGRRGRGRGADDDDDDDADDDDDDADEDPDEDDEPMALEIDDSDPDGPDLVRVRLTPLAARAFVERSLRTVAAGRPPCPFCGQPLDPTGHICPRKNGYVH